MFWTTQFLNFGHVMCYGDLFFSLGSLTIFHPPIFVHILSM
jgi:hypothetical protein